MIPRILICDDSALARKQLARALPTGFDADITYAENGQEAVEAIREDHFDLLFLDLTMPVMDGYEVLEALHDEELMRDMDVVVVSGDIQREAQNQVYDLGARNFIQKPCCREQLGQLLFELGLHDEARPHTAVQEPPVSNEDIDPLDRIGEIANVAMGRAASLLADVMNVFVVLPLPLVNEVEPSELQMAVSAVGESSEMSAVCQGFIGSGISGEAFLLLHDSNLKELSTLMHYDNFDPQRDRIELLMDIANILISASLKGIEEQLDLRFSRRHPVVLGQQEGIGRLLEHGDQNWKRTLAIEFDYRIKGEAIQCTLMLLFSEKAIPILHRRTAYLG